jgi:hypothetical protein
MIKYNKKINIDNKKNKKWREYILHATALPSTSVYIH